MAGVKDQLYWFGSCTQETSSTPRADLTDFELFGGCAGSPVAESPVEMDFEGRGSTLKAGWGKSNSLPIPLQDRAKRCTKFVPFALFPSHFKLEAE